MKARVEYSKMDPHDESDQDEPQPPRSAAITHDDILQRLLANTGSDDSDSDEDEASAPAATAPAPAAASSSCNDAADAPAEEESSSALPSALDVLFDGGTAKPDFLTSAAHEPEFDASKHFKPPPVTHAELTGVVGEHMAPAHQHVRSTLPPKSLDDPAPEEPRFALNQHEALRSSGQRRVRGSMCTETEAERGRRIVYGAHAATMADPWSACNPNKQWISHASGKKRPRGDTEYRH